MFKALLGKRAVQEKALTALIGSLGEAATQTARREVYAEFFVLAHAGQGFRYTVNNSVTFHCRQARADDDGHVQ